MGGDVESQRRCTTEKRLAGFSLAAWGSVTALLSTVDLGVP